MTSSSPRCYLAESSAYGLSAVFGREGRPQTSQSDLAKSCATVELRLNTEDKFLRDHGSSRRSRRENRRSLHVSTTYLSIGEAQRHVDNDVLQPIYRTQRHLQRVSRPWHEHLIDGESKQRASCCPLMRYGAEFRQPAMQGRREQQKTGFQGGVVATEFDDRMPVTRGTQAPPPSQNEQQPGNEPRCTRVQGILSFIPTSTLRCNDQCGFELEHSP